MREPYKILLLFTITLVLYLPSIGSGYFGLDDMTLVKHVTPESQFQLSTLLHHQGGNYFRPIMELSYILDARLWDMKASVLHLENILIHFINSLMVYLVVQLLLPAINNGKRLVLPLLSAVLFAVHPVNTESINWISGRTDPLATAFSLLALYLFLQAWQKQKMTLIIFSAIFVLLGCMAKEVAFFMGPGFILVLLCLRPTVPLPHPGGTWRLAACVPFTISMGLYLFMRSAGFSRTDKGIGKITSTIVTDDAWQKAETMLSAFGFYMKKVILPFPLNFAIDRVEPVYFWVGIVTALLSLALLLRRDLLSVFLLFIVLTIFPALLNAVMEFAWTPYAERYLYLSSAMLAIGLSTVMPQRVGLQKFHTLLIVILIACYLPVSLQRNLLWTNELKFMELTHAQSPQHAVSWNLYAIQIANAEDYPSARKEFNTILSSFPENQFGYRNLALMEEYINDPESARQVLGPFFKGDMVPDERTLAVMVKVNQSRLAANQDPEQHKVIHDELISSRLRLFDLTKEPELLLAAADSAREIDEFDLAGELLDRTIALKSDNPEISNEIERIRGMIDDRP